MYNIFLTIWHSIAVSYWKVTNLMDDNQFGVLSFTFLLIMCSLFFWNNFLNQPFLWVKENFHTIYYLHDVQVLAHDGENVAVLVQRALLYESMEKYKLGAEDLRTVMKLDPGNRVARSTIHCLIKMAE